MTQEKIARINELAKKSKTTGLTEAEKAGLAAGMASNIVPCVGLIVFTLLVAKLPEE